MPATLPSLGSLSVRIISQRVVTWILRVDRVYTSRLYSCIAIAASQRFMVIYNVVHRTCTLNKYYSRVAYVFCNKSDN